MSVANGVRETDDISLIWQEYRQKSNISLRNKLIDYYLEKTKILSSKLYASRLSNIADYNDYLHYGILGLISSIERYNPSYGAQFFTFASYRIKGSILDGISTMEERTASPSNELIFKNRLSLINEYQNESDDLFESLVETSVMLAMGIMLEYEEQPSEQYSNQSFQELKSTLCNYVDLLDSDQRLVIQYHYFHQFQFVTIAEILGLTKSRISQLHSQALSNLRKKCSSSLELEL